MATYRLGELFCGAGGLGYGALQAQAEGSRIVHTWATDFDPDACRTYVRNICPDKPESVLCEDIRTLDMVRLQELGDIDALAFGFPCNDFSTVGKHKGLTGAYGPLYAYGVKALEVFQPQWFIAENVGGLKSANGGKALEQILSDLQGAGYRVYPHLYCFENYGLPQARHRYIIVGIRSDIDAQYVVPPTAAYDDVDNSCRTALTVPPVPDDASNHEKTKQSALVVERLSHIGPGQNAFDAYLPEHLQLRVRGAKISQIYRRLDPNKPAYTVTAAGGGGTHMYHWKEPRALTNRERARLQTFPDSFVFEGKKDSVRKQIGMAVPPRGAQIVCEAVLRSLAAEKRLPAVACTVQADFLSEPLCLC